MLRLLRNFAFLHFSILFADAYHLLTYQSGLTNLTSERNIFESRFSWARTQFSTILVSQVRTVTNLSCSTLTKGLVFAWNKQAYCIFSLSVNVNNPLFIFVHQQSFSNYYQYTQHSHKFNVFRHLLAMKSRRLSIK